MTTPDRHGGRSRAGPAPRRRGAGPIATIRLLTAAFILAAAIILATSPTAARTWPPWQRDEAPVTYPDLVVDAAWVAARQGDPAVVLVDARDRGSFILGHLPGARNVPAQDLRPGPQLGHHFGEAGLAADDTLVCYGEASGETAPARLFWLLECAGARHVRFLDGGCEAWRRAGLGLVRAFEILPPRAWEAAPDTTRLADRALVRDRFGERGWEILDARAAGFGSTGSAMKTAGSAWRGGHVPHALPADFLAFLDEEGHLPPGPELRTLIGGIGPRPNTYVDLRAAFIVYDEGGAGAAARGYFVLRLAGIPEVRVYPGGWRDWSADPAAPRVRITTPEEVEQSLEAEGPLRDPAAPPRDFVLLDVRHDLDYAKGHLPGAVCLPAHQCADSLATVLARHWPGRDAAALPAVVYCYGTDCIRSRNCATILARRGFTRLEWLHTGIRGWLALGGETVASPCR